MEKRVQQLELGMTKQEVVNIMGKDYFVESVSQKPEGKLEILHFRSTYYVPYLVYFTDGRLTEYHRYIPPTPINQEIRVVKEKPNN